MTFPGPLTDKFDSLHDIARNSQDDKCVTKISSWMSQCAEHEKCYQFESVPLPERIIEVSPDPLVSPRIVASEGQKGAYIILSHHHPSADSASSSTEAQPKDILPANLDIALYPKAIADAIDITRRLGYRYLWIRQLCLTTSEFSENPAHFLGIYGRASLMLTASIRSELNLGLFHERNILQSPALGITKDRYLRPRALRWMTNIEESPLSRQGWNVIERILAPRIVHFTDRQLVWECASGCQFEAVKIIKEQESGPRINGYDKKLFQQFVESALLSPSTDINETPYAGEESPVARLEAWTDSVNALSWGSFENPSDKLLVVGKSALAISDGSMGDYLAGIWSKHVASGLAWGRMFSPLTSATEYVAPTWSWASVDGPVGIDDVRENLASDSAWAQKYQPELVSHHILYADPSTPYGNVLPGSHIVLDAACIGFKRLTSVLKDDEESFRVRPILDQSLMFECICCRPRSAEVQEADSEKFNREIDHHVCAVLKIDDWTTKTDNVGPCVCLVLKASDGDDSYTRVGFLTVAPNCWNKPVNPSGTFDRLGWERRQLRLV